MERSKLNAAACRTGTLLKLAVFLIAAFGLSGCFGEYYRGRFLLTLVVSVDGEVRTAQSVFEVAYNHSRMATPGSGGVISDFKGAMPQMDLGPYGSFVVAAGFVPRVLASENCTAIGLTRMPSAVMGRGEANPVPVTRKLINTMRRAEGKFSIEKYSLQVMYVPKDGELRDYKAFPLCDIGQYAGSNVRFVDITIEHTDLPVLTEIPDSLPWIVAWREEFETLKNNNPRWSYASVWPYPRPGIVQFSSRQD